MCILPQFEKKNTQVTRSWSHSKDWTILGQEPQGVRITAGCLPHSGIYPKLERIHWLNWFQHLWGYLSPGHTLHLPSSTCWLPAVFLRNRKATCKPAFGITCWTGCVSNQHCRAIKNPLHDSVLWSLLYIPDGTERYGNGCTFTVHSHFQVLTVCC